MALEPWDPFGQMVSLREAMDRLLQDTFVRPSQGWRQTDGNKLALDVHEEENDYKIEASLPGVKPEDVQIQVMGDTVTIRGEMHVEREEKRKGNELLRERRTGSFVRTFSLPMAVDADHAHAQFENGVLTLVLPKAEAAKPRRIPLTGARTEQQRENVPIDTTAQTQQGGQMPGQMPGGQTEETPPVH
jgi:HSP20 family protein